MLGASLTVPSLVAAVLGDEVFVDIALILLISAAAGAVATWLRQPLVVAFVAVGIVVGPSVLGLARPGGELELLAGMGIALLLFVVGLKLDLHVVRTLGPVAVVVGCVQVALTAAAGFVVALALGVAAGPAVYVGIGVAFSSTIIVVKLLSDRREIDDLHGRLAVGILIVQDLIVVLVMIAVTARGESGESVGLSLLTVVGKGAGMLVVLVLLMRFVLTALLHRLARLPDLLVLFAIAWAVSLGAAGELLDFGGEVGAFLAGVSLASTPYREAIASRLVTIRDFLLLFFFIELGSQLDPGLIRDQLVAGLVLSAVVLVAKPLIVVGLLGALRYRRRVGLETGLALAQISEFSLILGALALRLGRVDEETTALLTTVALITIAVSVYLFQQSEALASRLDPLLGFFERQPPREPDDTAAEPPDVIVLGLGRFGHGIVEGLQEHGLDVLGVDFDPVTLSRWEERGIRVVYGDAEDPELPQVLPLPERGWVVSTIRGGDANLALLHALAHHRYRGRVAVAAHRPVDAERLTAAGADHVLRPYAAAAGQVVDLIASGPPGARSGAA